MNPLWLLFLLGLLLCSCKEKPLASSPATNPSQGGASPSAAPAIPEPARPPLTVPAEQLGSVLRVRVAFGGLPPRDTVAALLHRDEIENKALAQGNTRFVITLLKGWTEAQIDNPNAHFFVYRNKVNANGLTEAVMALSDLVSFDPATSVAILRYAENFEYSADVGFHLDRLNLSHHELRLLRASPGALANGATQNQPENSPSASGLPTPSNLPPGMPEARRNRLSHLSPLHSSLAEFLVDVGEYSASKPPQNAVRFPENTPPAEADVPYLAIDSRNELTGFVVTSSGAPALTPLANIRLDFPTPVVKVTGVSFEGRGGQIDMKAQFAFEPANYSPRSLMVALAEAPPATLAEAAQPNAEGYFAPLQSHQFRNVLLSNGAADWKGAFTKIEAGTEKSYLVQFNWPIFGKDDGQSRVYGQPFLVRLTAKADGVYPTLEGLPGIVAAPPVSGSAPAAAINAPARLPASLSKVVDFEVTGEAGPVAKFAMESTVRNIHLVAGGREVLFELEDAPYWKRFSFEKNDWLPLPPGNLSNVSITGNLSALFILDRGLNEVRKYYLPTLQAAGSVKLPGTEQYAAILAGCNSEHAPVHLLAPHAIALAPEDLHRRDLPSPVNSSDNSAGWDVSRTQSYSISGDGLSICSSGDSQFFASYNSDRVGLQRSYFDSFAPISPRRKLGVTGGFQIAYNGVTCLDNPGGTPIEGPKLPNSQMRAPILQIAQNAPVIFRLTNISATGAEPAPPRVSCFSFFDARPFVTVDAPELADLQSSPRSGAAEINFSPFFDPNSFHLGILSPDHKTWLVHSLTRPPTLDQPVLLNWPDTSILRGGEFQFKPFLLGGAQFTAEIYAKPGRAIVDSAQGTVRSAIGAQELDPLELLTLKVPGKDASGLSYPISLHVAGLPPPFAAKPNADHKGLSSSGSGFKSLDRSTSEFYPFTSTLHAFKDQVVDIQGPVSGCAALVSVANRIDFLSLQTRKIVGSTVIPTGAFYYAGAGALIEYDPGKRTLTRISVPDGRRERTLTLPPNVQIGALGVGTNPGSPITLGMNIAQSESITRFSDLTFTSTTYRNLMVVLDGNTLQAAGWAQPVSLARMLNSSAQDPNYGFMGPPGAKPPVLPASHDGCVVTLQGSLLIISPTSSVSYPFGNRDTNILSFSGRFPQNGSISGLMATSADGQTYKGGSKVPSDSRGMALGSTPCGRYRLIKTMEPSEDEMMEVHAAETDAPLLIATRFLYLHDDPFVHLDRPIIRRITTLGDNGPLALLSPSGRELQLVDFDIPAIMKTLEPEEFHVVSQPAPYVVEGGALQYQVQVNNAAAVKSVRLQSPVPGAFISSQGLLRYTAPTHITGPTQVNISIEIAGKNGNAVLHEFPIFILPHPRAASKPQINPI